MAGRVVALVAVAVAVAGPWWQVAGQVALRTAPLTAARTRDNSSSEDGSGGGLSSPWAGLELRHKGTNAIESSLAAIFRGVAYGVSTSQPTTPPPPPPTTPPPTTPPPRSMAHPSLPPLHRDDQGAQPWMPPETAAEVQQKAVTDPRGATLAHRPIQTPYIEPPGASAPAPGERGAPNVVVADVGVGAGQVGWVRGLGVAWVVHVYCAAAVYSVLGVVALVWAARVGTATRLLPRGYYLTLHLLMFLAAFLRCVHLFHDPYGAARRLPPALAALVHETGWPCLTAALGVVILAIVRAWRCPRLIPRRPHAPLALALLTAAHLMASVAAHLTSALMPEHAGPLRAAARAVTAAWGGAVGIGGFLSAWRVGRAAGRQPGQLLVRLSRGPLEGTLPPRHPRMALVWGCRLAAAASVLQVALAALHMYALVGPHYLTQLPPLYPWRWLAHESACRVLEVLAWILLAAVSMLRVGGASTKRHGEARLLAAVTCGRCGSCASVAGDRVDEVFPAVCQTNQAVRNFTLQSGKAVYQEALAAPPLGRRASTVRVTHKKPSIRKSATLHSATSDIHLLWNHVGNGDPSDGSSRPSSMLVNDAGFVRFKMQTEHRSVVDHSMCKSMQNVTLPTDNVDSQCSDDPPAYHHALYANTPACDNKISAQSAVSPRYEDPYDNANLEILLQSRLQDLYGGGGEAASITDCSSTDALSPPPPIDTDWSKYASTCSSISAANSFDVRMYDDLEVASYYQSPSPASSQVYASLNRPAPRGRLARQRTVYEAPPSLHGYEARQAVEQLTALLARPPPPRHDPLGPASDSDMCSSGSRSRHDDRPWRHPRRPPLHDLTPDSAVVVDDLTHTDEASGDDGDSSSPRLGPVHPRPTGLLTKIVKNNFSMNNGGYSPLSSEDVHHYQQALLRHHHHQQQQQDQQQKQGAKGDERGERDRVRPCGHRPRGRAPREDTTPSSPTRVPVHRSPPPVTHPHKPRRGSAQQEVKEEEEEDPMVVADGTTQTESRTWPPASPTSSRPASSLASHSDLPSECVDSEDDLHYRPSHEGNQDSPTPELDLQYNTSSNATTPTLPAWHSPTRAQVV